MFKTTLAVIALVVTPMIAFGDEAKPHYDKDVNCLAEALYFEARGVKSEKAWKNIAWVINNRAKSKHYPNTICGVVRQANKKPDGTLIKWQCAFTFYCDGVAETIANVAVWNEIVDVAETVITDFEMVQDPTNGADHYHTPKVKPKWRDTSKVTIPFDGAHIFYDLVRG